MKTKKFEKKLVLSRKTIANLNNRELERIQGGTEPRSIAEQCKATETDPCFLSACPYFHC